MEGNENGPAPWVAAQVFAHPVRARIVSALRKVAGPRSPSALAAELGEPLGTVSYHVKVMLKLGVVVETGTRPVRGALEHFYALSDDPRIRALADAVGAFENR